MTDSAVRTNPKLEALRSRETELKAKIAMEKVRQQKRDEKDSARLCSIIGRVLLENAAKHSDFELLLKGVLQSSTAFNEGEKKLLKARNWL